MDKPVYNQHYVRKVDKCQIPVCDILGVHTAAINMDWLLDYLACHITDLKGDYICVSNVHTTMTAYRNTAYRQIQNGGLMAIPDGKPLSIVGRRRGFSCMDRIPGPDLMERVFALSAFGCYTHYFYGSTEETLNRMKKRLLESCPRLQIVGTCSPPFRTLSQTEDDAFVAEINQTAPDFVWVGLGAPKQEKWMAEHQGKVNGLMIGVGAGFDYLAGNIKRAPGWMQQMSLEWAYRLLQDPLRLTKRYLCTNPQFIWHAYIRGR